MSKVTYWVIDKKIKTYVFKPLSDKKFKLLVNGPVDYLRQFIRTFYQGKTASIP